MVILGAADGAFVVTPPYPDRTPEPPVTEAPDLPPFEHVYREHAARVYRYCLSQVGNASDAEDLAAEVFAAAFAAYQGVRGAEGVLAWLLRIARNEIIDHRRRRTRRSALLVRFFGGGSELDMSVNVESEVVSRDELRQVIDAMRHLSDRDRVLIGLRVAADLRTGRSAW